MRHKSKNMIQFLVIMKKTVHIRYNKLNSTEQNESYTKTNNNANFKSNNVNNNINNNIINNNKNKNIKVTSRIITPINNL